MIDNYIGEKPKGLTDEKFNEFTFTTAKVVDVILDSNHVDYKKMGGNAGLGAIKYEILKDAPTTNKNTLTYALPLISFIKSYPLIGETVLVLNGLPTVNSGNRNIISFSYYLCDVNLFNTPHINYLGKPFKENKYFKEKSEFHPLFALEGDRILEGRNNQTLRFTTDKEGFPKAILRVTNKIPKQNDKNNFIDENINIDETTMMFSTKGKIQIEIAYGNLASYNINISTGKSNIISTDVTNKPSTTVANSEIDKATLAPLIEVKTVEKQKELFKESLEKAVEKSQPLPSINEQDDFNVPTYTFQESDKLGLEIINIADYKDFDQLLYERQLQSGIEQGVEIDKEKTTNSSSPATVSFAKIPTVKQGQFEQHLGSITNTNIPIHVKALMEVIAYCEGTMGRSQNGYDVLQQVPRTDEVALVTNWTENYQGTHPSNGTVWFKMPNKDKMELVKLLSSASGRYQFVKETWNRVSPKGNIFTKDNQNIATNTLIKEYLGDDYYTFDYLIRSDEKGYYRALQQISKQWDSFPYGDDVYSYNTKYNPKVKNKQVCRNRPPLIKQLYIRAYAFYARKVT
jgi:muramidase (phage lysozyme)